MSTSSESNIKPQEIGLKFQRKFMSTITNNRTAVKYIIDSRLNTVLTNVHKLLKECYQSNESSHEKKEADKLIKYIIKVAVKVDILHRYKHFSDDELVVAEEMDSAFRKLMLTIESFCKFDYTYDFETLLPTLQKLHEKAKCLVENHVSGKSVSKLDYIFERTNEKKLWDAIFVNVTDHAEYKNRVHAIIIDLYEISMSKASTNSNSS